MGLGMGFHCPKCPNLAQGQACRGVWGAMSVPPDTRTHRQTDRRSRRCARDAQHRGFIPGCRRSPPCPAPAAFGQDSGLGSLLARPPPHPSPPFIFQPLTAAAGGRGERTAGAAAPCPFVEVFGAFPCWFGVFFLEGDFRASPPNLGAVPCGFVLVPGAARTPVCPHPRGEGVGGKVPRC